MCDAVCWLRSVPRNKQSTHNGFHNSLMSHIAFSANMWLVSVNVRIFDCSYMQIFSNWKRIVNGTNCRKPLITNHFTLTFNTTFLLLATSIFLLFQFFCVNHVDYELFKFFCGWEWLWLPPNGTTVLHQIEFLSTRSDELKCIRFDR